MKKLNILFTCSILSLALVSGCSNTTPSPIDQEEINSTLINKDDTKNINQYAIDNNQIIINLTPIGLYKHNKGNKLPSYYLENIITLTSWNVGDSLPLNDITSNVEHVKISTFVYYQNGGELSSSLTILKDQNFYQCYFTYDSSYTNPDAGKIDSTTITSESISSSDVISSDTTSSDTSSSSNTSSNIDDKERTIYFMDDIWWNKDAATSSIYYWGSISTDWPGVVMNYVEYVKTGEKSSDGSYELGKNVWSVTLDLSKVTGFMFARTKSEATAGSKTVDWGAKTIDITPTSLGDNNLVILNESSVKWSSSGGCNVKYATYVAGKLNY